MPRERDRPDLYHLAGEGGIRLGRPGAAADGVLPQRWRRSAEAQQGVRHVYGRAADLEVTTKTGAYWEPMCSQYSSAIGVVVVVLIFSTAEGVEGRSVVAADPLRRE